MFVFEKENLAADLNRKMTIDNLTPRTAGEEIGIAHTTVHRVQHKKDITMSTFIKLLNWLGKNSLYYIKYQNDKQ